MPLFRRRPRALPERLPLVLPRQDGTGWPAAAARLSFEASAYVEMGNRRAYEPAARALADLLVDTCLPRLSLGAEPPDEPYLRKVLLTAARVGAGIGLVDLEATGCPPGELDPSIAGALGAASRALPAMRDDWGRTATWFLLAGHFLARQEPSDVDAVLRALADQLR